jgi:Predicted xylanase/chitin deacetylase
VRDDPAVAITFDDAYLGAVTAGLDELTRRDMPFTVFVAPGLLGEEPWWDTAAEAMDGAIPRHVRSEWLLRLAGDGSAILREVPTGRSGHVANQSSVGSKISSAELLKEMATQRGASVASHAWTHRNLAALAEEGVRTELVRSIEWLRSRFSSFVPLLAYPYGLSSRMVEAVAAEVGYRAAFLIDGGWLPERPAMSPFTLPRMNVPAGLSLNGFRLRLSGIGTP